MEIIRSVIYWLSFAYYLYVFGYASLFKVFQKESMMKSMDSLGFGKIPTMLIGAGELLGVLILLVGLYKPEYRNIGILFLFPFAIGAFTTHMAHHEYSHFYNSLMMCILTVVLLLLDKNFKIIIQ